MWPARGALAGLAHVLAHVVMTVRPRLLLIRDLHLAIIAAAALLGGERLPAQERIDRRADVAVDRHPVAVLNLDQHGEGRRGLALQHRLLRPAPPRFLIGERHRLDPADQVGEGRVQHQVLEGVAVRRPDQLHPALGDRARRLGLKFRPDLVDHDHLRHVILDRLDHHRVLQRRLGHLHPPRPPDRRMRDVAIPRDLVARIDHHDPLAERVGQHARRLAQQRRLAHPRPPEDEDALARFHQILDDRDRPEDRAPDPAGQPDDHPRPVADGRDAVQRPLDPGAIILAEVPDPLRDVFELGARHILFAEHEFAPIEARLGLAPQVQHQLDQRAGILLAQPFDELRRQHREEIGEVVGDLLLILLALVIRPRLPLRPLRSLFVVVKVLHFQQVASPQR